jgi:predicted RNA-binding protein YlqC (UPF0109 family)
VVLRKIMEMFGKKDVKADTANTVAQSSAGAKGLSDIEHFVDYVVRLLVDKPEAVQTGIEKDEKGFTIIRISCDKSDIGKIIGKNGKTIMSIRTLASNASMRSGVKLSVEIVE